MPLPLKAHSAWNLAKYHRVRQEWIEKLGGKCVDCGTTEDLQFDHVDASTKEISISTVLTYAAPKVEAEMAKCELRCSSCHREKTAACGDDNSVPHGGGKAGKRRCKCDPCREKKREYMREYMKEYRRNRDEV